MTLCTDSALRTVPSRRHIVGPAPALPAGTIACTSCGTQPATHVLTYPDARFALCPSCVPATLRVLVEPLDDDDVLMLQDEDYSAAAKGTMA